jgi:hypothetical protein
MPATLYLNDAERAARVAVLRAQIKNTRWRLAPCTRALRSILAKLARAGVATFQRDSFPPGNPCRHTIAPYGVRNVNATASQSIEQFHRLIKPVGPIRRRRALLRRQRQHGTIPPNGFRDRENEAGLWKINCPERRLI